MNIRRILVPVDYSACSRAALEFATEFATATGASLDVVHVWDKPTYVSDAILVRQDGAAPRSLVEIVRDNAERDMSEFLASAGMADSPFLTRRLISGEPASKLLEELARGEHDLVIVGTHGRTGFSHFLLGSVAEKLVRLSPVPVLVVPKAKVQQ